MKTKATTALITIAVVMSLAWASVSQFSGIIQTTKVIDGVTVAASGSTTSDALDLNSIKMNGDCSLQITVTAGTWKVELLASNDGTNYVEPEGFSDIITGVTSAASPLTYYAPPVARFHKWKATETGGSAGGDVTVTVCTH